MNILTLKSKEVEDPTSNLMSLMKADLAATKEKWGYTIIKDRFYGKINVDMSIEEFWGYAAELTRQENNDDNC
jgi:hypothetical protein